MITVVPMFNTPENHRITKRNLTSAPSPFVGSGTGLRLKCKMTCTYNMENTVVSREWLSYVLYTTEIYEDVVNH